MSIKVRMDKNFGGEAIYPACETAVKFLALTGRKTLTRADIRAIKNLGYEVEVVTPTL